MPHLVVGEQATEIPDGWIEALRSKLEGTRFEGLLSRLDPYKDARYAGPELASLEEALAAFSRQAGRFTDATRLLLEAIRRAAQKGATVEFQGD